MTVGNLASRLLVLGCVTATPIAGRLGAQVRQAQPGFNLFSAQQDVEIGQQSAAEAEKQLPLLRDATVDAYLTRIVQRLAAVAPGAKFPYTVKAVNAAEVNAFSLPGGPMYVNRGLITATRSEAELAGVIAHEMAHVALRHGTHQASNAYLAQGGLALLGGLMGKGQGNTSSVLNAIGGAGMNTLFLKFSRNAEYEADATGADMMARAGYDPLAMATMFEMLRATQGRDPGKVEQFFSDHPGAADRETRIRNMASSLSRNRVAPVGNFASIQSRVGPNASGSDAAAASAAAVAAARGRLDPPANRAPAAAGNVTLSIPAPSARLASYSQPSGIFTISYPANWRPATSSGVAVTLAPPAGIVTTTDGVQHVAYGVIINHYAPFGSSATGTYTPQGTTARTGTLEEATNDLVRTILQSNPYLQAEQGSARPETIAGARGYSMLLSGTSPLTGQPEQVTLFTRALTDGHVIYALGVTPTANAAGMNRALVRMMRTLAVNDAAAHRAETARGRGRRGSATVP